MTARPAGRRGRGRPASAARVEGQPGTRDLILSSARAEFAARGYDRASIRAIARGAQVDPALVHHYFGSKEQVFEAAMETAFAPVLSAPEQLVADGIDTAGEQLTRFVFGLWENPATREPVLAIVRSAVNNETAARIFRQMITRHVLARVARELRLPDPDVRVQLAVAQLVGTAMLRYVIKVEPIASADPETLIGHLAPVVQHHLTGTLDTGHG
ncbi:TetR/AcrR family transcriptional regulator [Streptomyces armeniacus]|uniref:TetR/AcrR family transcriptional regulator n=1 Tax=Streptomyces armeniacus TaxID=83291 RepID=A0A345XYE8_9ACTN|nr:TetR family transcriptional regulator [Streptomyces armeniacus]AXK36664.1 TetR/AcrR family transcriptional regulator [Streptomyces armeniacus]